MEFEPENSILNLPEEILVEIFVLALSEEKHLYSKTARSLRVVCKRFYTILNSREIQRRLLLPLNDPRLRFRLLKTLPTDKVVTFLPGCWTYQEKIYSLAVPSTGTMNRFFIGIVTIDRQGNIEFLDEPTEEEEEEDPNTRLPAAPKIRPKYDHVDGCIAAAIAPRSASIYVVTRPVPRYEAGPVELWRFDLEERRWYMMDSWELDFLWGASMSILFNESVLMLVGGLSALSTTVDCYIYLLSSRVGYGTVTNIIGKPPPLLEHKAYSMQTGNSKPRKTGSWIEKDNSESLLVLGTACGHHNDGNLHYQLQVTWGKRAPKGKARKSQIRIQTEFYVSWSKLQTKFPPPQRGRAQCAGLSPDAQFALVHSYCVLGQREPPSLFALNLLTMTWSETCLAQHSVEGHPVSNASQPAPDHPPSWSCLPCQGLVVVTDEKTLDWKVVLLNSDFGRAAISFLTSEYKPKNHVSHTVAKHSSKNSCMIQ
eukprot:TRINITY_DN4929_c0_g1_i1.p1 TRINITY_DN4929_c0_g1~~TRINITY_DN4929_c0_g1_i1.p1  ORF type:complete len:482 (+),score=75.03 TRINITY_DN4929_c0_g1_i1:107-1552(+)